MGEGRLIVGRFREAARVGLKTADLIMVIPWSSPELV